MLAGLDSAGGFRSNLGITSMADVDSTVTTRVYDDRGALIGQPGGEVGQHMTRPGPLADPGQRSLVDIDDTYRGRSRRATAASRTRRRRRSGASS